MKKSKISTKQKLTTYLEENSEVKEKIRWPKSVKYQCHAKKLMKQEQGMFCNE